MQESKKLVLDLFYNDEISISVGTCQDVVKHRLYATLFHSGQTLQSGHYFAVTQEGDVWTKFDDDRV